MRQRILNVINIKAELLDMNNWESKNGIAEIPFLDGALHQCDTTHCVAGWYGKYLEKESGWK